MDRTASAIKVLDAQGAYCGQCSREPGDSLDACRDCAAVLESYAHALEAAGLLAPDAQVIRTMEELRQFDEETVFMNIWSDLFDVSNVHAGMNREDFPYYFPCAVVATGEQVRAARKALEEENG